MPEWGPQDGRRAECYGQRLGRSRRDNTVSTGQHGEGRPAQQLWADRIARNPPQIASGFVVAIPGTPAVARYPEGQRHAVVDPILESNKPTRLVTREIEGCKPAEFAFC